VHGSFVEKQPPLGIHEETPTTKDGFMAESKPLVFRFGDVELREQEFILVRSGESLVEIGLIRMAA